LSRNRKRPLPATKPAKTSNPPPATPPPTKPPATPPPTKPPLPPNSSGRVVSWLRNNFLSIIALCVSLLIFWWNRQTTKLTQAADVRPSVAYVSQIYFISPRVRTCCIAVYSVDLNYINFGNTAASNVVLSCQDEERDRNITARDLNDGGEFKEMSFISDNDPKDIGGKDTQFGSHLIWSEIMPWHLALVTFELTNRHSMITKTAKCDLHYSDVFKDTHVTPVTIRFPLEPVKPEIIQKTLESLHRSMNR
jgi:hypothetical protein